MIPDVLHIGPIPIHLFGIFLALAFLAAAHAASREFGRRGYDPELASGAVLWAALGGLLVARLWLVLEAWPEFVRDPASFLLTGGGFVFYGGLAGGALAMTVFFWRHGIPWLRGADIVAPAIALGQAIGRIGCQVSGDGDWGRVTQLPWGMAYPHAVVCAAPCECVPDPSQGGQVHCLWPAGVTVHPTPIYECLAYLAVFAFLWRRRREPAPDGTLFAWYLVLAAGARLAIEFVRTNPVAALGLTQAQLTSLALIAVGGWRLLAARARRPAAARAVVLLLLLLGACGGPRPAPDFTATDLGGRAVRLSALRGKVVLLNLWTTWCPPCREEMPSMEQLHRRLRDREFVLLAVSEDELGKAVVEPFVRELGLTFPVLVDPERQVGQRYEVWGYPESFVIDRNGLVVERVIGPRNWAAPEHVARIEALLSAGVAPSPPAPPAPS